MSKTFKLSFIILFSVTGLQVMRILSSLLPLSDNILGWGFSFMMQCLFLGLFPYLIYKATIKEGCFVRDVKIKAKVNPLSYLIAVLIGLLTYGVNIGASSIWYVILNALGFTYTRGGGVLFTSPEVLILEIITSCMLPAIFEEITDRGILLASLDDVKSDTIKIIVLGLFFGACHQNAPQLGPTALAGVIIGFMAVKSGSILPGMIVHFINNFIITIGSYVDQKGINLGLLTQIEDALYSSGLILLVSAGCGILLVFTLYLFQKINAKYIVKDDEQINNTLYEVYGFGASPKKKAGALDYSLLVIAFISALLVTGFTFYWGLMR